MSTITLQEAQAKLPHIIAQMKPGESIQIVDHEQAIARLTIDHKPLRKKRQPGTAKGQLIVVSEDDEHLKDFEPGLQVLQ